MAPKHHRAQDMHSGEYGPPAILVVEDEALIRIVAHDTLIEGGYAVIEAGNAAEALELLAVRPDIVAVITDVNEQGEMNGFPLALIVAKKWPNIAILVVSGAEEPKDGDMPPGAEFLAKPCAPSALLEFMSKVIGLKSE